MQTPDITKVQAVALVAAAMDVAINFGVTLTAGQEHSLLAFFGVLAGIIFADAHIRRGRAQVAVQQIHADAALRVSADRAVAPKGAPRSRKAAS